MYLTANEAAGGAPQTMNCPGGNDINCTRTDVTFGPNDNFGGGHKSLDFREPLCSLKATTIRRIAGLRWEAIFLFLPLQIVEFHPLTLPGRGDTLV